MNTMLLKLYVKLQDLMSREEGQDLIEYALLAAILSLGCVTILKTLATAISTEFASIGSSLAGAVA